MLFRRRFKRQTGVLLISGLLVLSILLLLLVSCKQPTQVLPSAPAPGPVLTITEVEISGFAFVPATITIPVGTPVTWFNKDSVAHTVSGREGVFDSGNLSGGATFSYTFDQTGSFEYYCKIHSYMKGEVIVE